MAGFDPSAEVRLRDTEPLTGRALAPQLRRERDGAAFQIGAYVAMDEHTILERVLVLPVLLMFLGLSPAYGQPTTNVVFMALSPSSTEDAQAGASFSAQALSGGDPVDCTNHKDFDEYTLRHVGGLLGCALANTNPLGASGQPVAGPPDSLDSLSLANRANAARALRQVVVRERDAGDNRVSGGRGDILLMVGFHNATLARISPADGDSTVELFVEGRPLSFAVNETERQTQLVADISTLADVALALRGGDRGLDTATSGQDLPLGRYTQEQIIWLSTQRYRLRNERSTLSVSHNVQPALRRLLSGIRPAEHSSAENAETIAPSRHSAGQLDEWNIAQQLHELKTRLMVTDGSNTALSCSDLPEKRRGILRDTEASQAHGSSRPALRIAMEPANTIIALCLVLRYSAPRDAAVTIVALEALGRSPSALTRRVLAQLVTSTTGDVRAAALAASITPDPPRASLRSTPASGDVQAEASSVSLLSGPDEHWYMSADVMITDDLRVSRDDGGGLVISETPPVFYVAANYLVGDLLSNRRPWWGNIFFKVFAKGSKHPQDSVGLGVGLRGPTLPLLNVELELLSPYLAWTWTRVDDGDGVSRRQPALRFGLSVNLDRALKWVDQ